MRKVIGFKLNLRLKEIQRRAKKAKLDAGPEAELQDLLTRASAAIKPGVLFETYQHSDPDQPLLSPVPGLAFSAILITLGEGFTRLADATPSPLWPVIADAALDEGLRFAANIVTDDALKEGCELSPITNLTEAAPLEALLRKLDGAKIGVRLDEGRLLPAASLAASLCWLARSKAKGKAK